MGGRFLLTMGWECAIISRLFYPIDRGKKFVLDSAPVVWYTRGRGVWVGAAAFP